MSWCTLTLSVQDGDRPLHAGDVLEGEVVVEVTRAGRCFGLRVELRCHALGKGKDHEEALTVLPLFVGVWTKAETLRYPFRLTIPPAPPPFKGEGFTVSHVLRATADLHSAIEPRVDHPLTLAPSPEWRSAAATQAPVGAPFKGLLFDLMMVLFLLVCVLLFHRFPSFWPLLVPVAASFLVRDRRNTISAWRTPKAVVTVPRRIHPGLALPVLIELDRFAAPLKAVSATLVCTERVISGNEEDPIVYERIHYEEQVVLTPSDEQTRFEGLAALPDLSLWSFEGGFNSVTWALKVHLECSRWPDWIMSWPLSMDPPETPALA